MSQQALPRLDYAGTAPNAYQAMAKLSNFVRNCGLESLLLELVMVRVSQMNGGAYCVDWHARRARDSGNRSGASIR
jgi:AhpD family alkylhydroperoxidase